MLTQKGTPWIWSEDCESAFQELRQKLVIEPVKLAFPKWGEELYIESDASRKGVAAVLSQKEESTGVLRPISYFSSALTPAQANYSAGQLEAWALLAASRKWDLYLKSAPRVNLITDHCPLQWLRRQKDPRHHFSRWLMELETIPYTIAFRPGSSNQVPDYLSRAPDLTVDEEVNEESFFEDRVYPAEDGWTGDDEAGWIERIAEEQRKDFIVNDAKEQLKRSGKVRRGQLKHASDHLNLRGGMLNFDNRLVIPTTLRKEAIGRIHRSSHFGQTRTTELMKRNYFWARMARDVKKFCRNCLICQKVKAKSLPAQPMEQFKEEGWLPGDVVAMDIATLPWGDGLFRYFIIMVDLFSQYVELAPLEDQTAESVVREFKRSWIYRGHGVPKVLLTDQGPNVDGQKVREMCGQLGIEKRHTTAYHPQADGMAERGIGTVKQTIRC